MGTISLTPKMLSNEKFWKLWTLYYYISFHYPKSTFYPTSVNTCETILAKNQPKEKNFQKFLCCDDTLRILQIPLRVFQNDIMTFEVFRNLGQKFEICLWTSSRTMKKYVLTNWDVNADFELITPWIIFGSAIPSHELCLNFWQFRSVWQII